MTLTIGSACSGYGGLEMGVSQLLGGHVAWHAEINPDAVRILEHHWPGVPNLGDLTTVDWQGVEPVDVLCAGFPCQDVSPAGKRLGLRPGTRTGIWSNIAYGIGVLRPRLVLLENVGGLLSAGAHSDMEPCPWCVGDAGCEHVLRALGAVLGDLAGLGYDASWVRLRAADVGAPHGRARVFIAATDTEHSVDLLQHGTPFDAIGRRSGETEQARLGRGTPADTRGGGVQRRGIGRVVDGAARPGEGDGGEWEWDGDAAVDRGATPADAARDGRNEGRPEPARLQWGPHAPVSGDAPADANDAATDGQRPRTQPRQRSAAPADADDDGREGIGRLDTLGRDTDGRRGEDAAWGAYEPAIRRWERVLGRPAPRPTEPSARGGGQRLSPRFVEWMMGLPDGHVTAVPGLSRNAQLTALGNGVVPLQAAAGYRIALDQLARQEAADTDPGRRPGGP